MKGVNPKDLNKKVKPTDDFFEFANGGWIKRNPIPASETRWGSFYELAERNRKALLAILNEASKKKTKPGTNLQKVGDYYASAMDTKAINAVGLKPLEAELKKIDAIRNTDDLVAAVAHLHSLDVSAFWFPHAEADDKNSEMIILRLYQHGLGLPDRDYYTRTDAKSKDIREKYLQHIEKVLKLMGFAPREAKTGATTIVELETRLAHASMTRVEQRDPHRMYNKLTVAKLQKLTPHIDWKSYLKKIGVNVTTLVVSQPEFLKAVDQLFHTGKLDEIKTYLKFHLVNDYSGYLASTFEKQAFWFYGTVLNGVKKMKPRWKRAISMVDDALGEALGQLYVEKHFPPSAKKKMMELIEDIRSVYQERIKGLDWMSAATKKKALKKLSAITYKIGYPDKWRDYSKLPVTRDSLMQNALAAAEFDFKRRMRQIGKPLDRNEWFMTPPTVNAYYSPNRNEIVFPAGILQPPYFSEDQHDALNYGAIGAIIGHELTHGFDDEGSQFDAKGNLKNWWTKEDRNKFEKKAQLLVKEFDGYVALDDLHVNGKLTLGENIADLGGLVIAFHAFQRHMKHKKLPSVHGMTPNQLFFYGFAVSERGVYRPEALRERVLTDPHSPPKFRVNGPVSNAEEFYETFGCQVGDALYRPEAERAKIW